MQCDATHITTETCKKTIIFAINVQLMTVQFSVKLTALIGNWSSNKYLIDKTLKTSAANHMKALKYKD